MEGIFSSDDKPIVTATNNPSEYTVLMKINLRSMKKKSTTFLNFNQLNSAQKTSDYSSNLIKEQNKNSIMSNYNNNTLINFNSNSINNLTNNTEQNIHFDINKELSVTKSDLMQTETNNFRSDNNHNTNNTLNNFLYGKCNTNNNSNNTNTTNNNTNLIHNHQTNYFLSNDNMTNMGMTNTKQIEVNGTNNSFFRPSLVIDDRVIREIEEEIYKHAEKRGSEFGFSEYIKNDVNTNNSNNNSNLILSNFVSEFGDESENGNDSKLDIQNNINLTHLNEELIEDQFTSNIKY